jgi:hypothetical protein
MTYSILTAADLSPEDIAQDRRTDEDRYREGVAQTLYHLRIALDEFRRETHVGQGNAQGKVWFAEAAYFGELMDELIRPVEDEYEDALDSYARRNK